jgi:hypothetical protein
MQPNLRAKVNKKSIDIYGQIFNFVPNLKVARVYLSDTCFSIAFSIFCQHCHCMHQLHGFEIQL